MFPMSRLARCTAAVMLATSALASSAQTARALPPIAAFFDGSHVVQPTFSPNGKLLATISRAPGKRGGLTVIDLATNQFYTAARFPNADVAHFQWVNNERLMFDTSDQLVSRGKVTYAPGLYAANYDGSKMKQLADRNPGGGVQVAPSSKFDHLLPRTIRMSDDPGAQDSDSAYVINPSFGGSNRVHDTNLLLVDTLNGRSRRVERPDNTDGWLLDRQGQPRLAISIDDAMQTIHYRDPGSDTWRALVTQNVFSSTHGVFQPLAFGPDGTLYVKANNGSDKASVYALDLATGKVREPALITMTDYDFAGKLIMGKDKLLGFRATTDAESTIWLDPAMKALQEEIDKRLDGTVNLVSVPTRPEAPWVLVDTYSDVRPHTIMLYNTETKAFTKVGDAHPGIRPAQMGTQKTISYKARDGLTIPALLTLPPGPKRDHLPLVVLVHGGPYVRGSTWGWHPESQFLASRGYAVLEPSYRGTTGFGEKHYRAGWKQWGLAMQDDIADGAKWAIAQGLVDPKRICIAGASYGGYATLMGLVNDPDLYKCGVEWVGVTDIGLFADGHWSYESDMTDRFRTYGMPELIGDPVKDAARLKATSPLAQAARIKQPLLLAYGGGDMRVPLYHGNQFYAAIKQTNADVEWIVYPDEGHGWSSPQTRFDFWARVEKFLDRNIGSK